MLFSSSMTSTRILSPDLKDGVSCGVDDDVAIAPFPRQDYQLVYPDSVIAFFQARGKHGSRNGCSNIGQDRVQWLNQPSRDGVSGQALFGLHLAALPVGCARSRGVSFPSAQPAQKTSRSCRSS